MNAPRVIVIGARTARQGIGEYVAAWFARLGAQVVGIVGTSTETVAEARAILSKRHRLDCHGYTSLRQALARESADIVAICSPYRFHREHLAEVGQAGLHCLCEKPFIWPAGGGEPDVLAPFVEAGRYLDLLTQWPCTLPAFDALHPGTQRSAVERFEMRLSPVSAGLDMVPDAAPHFLSMLRALCGSGSFRGLSATFLEGDSRRLCMEGRYEHPAGSTAAVLSLETCPQRPRPAWYAINGSRADRDIELPAYAQFFRCGDRRVPLEDPLGGLIARFLARIQAGAATDCAALYDSQRLLTMMDHAARAAQARGGRAAGPESSP